MSTRSSYSVPEYETHDLSSRNNEQMERAIQYNIKEVNLKRIFFIYHLVFPSSHSIKNKRKRKYLYYMNNLKGFSLSLSFSLTCFFSLDADVNIGKYSSYGLQFSFK